MLANSQISYDAKICKEIYTFERHLLNRNTSEDETERRQKEGVWKYCKALNEGPSLKGRGSNNQVIGHVVPRGDSRLSPPAIPRDRDGLVVALDGSVSNGERSPETVSGLGAGARDGAEIGDGEGFTREVERCLSEYLLFEMSSSQTRRTIDSPAMLAVMGQTTSVVGSTPSMKLKSNRLPKVGID